jgi:hypothetical protein
MSTTLMLLVAARRRARSRPRSVHRKPHPVAESAIGSRHASVREGVPEIFARHRTMRPSTHQITVRVALTERQVSFNSCRYSHYSGAAEKCQNRS